MKNACWQWLIPVALIVVVVISTLCIGNVPGGEDSRVQELASRQVREYHGENLSSITDFRENSIKGPQDIPIDAYRLAVGGLVEEPREYTYDEVLAAFPHYSKVVTLYCVEGWDVTILWEGVLISDILEASGAAPDATTVIFTAYDGYSTSLPLDYLVENDILLAYAENGVTLPPELGYPFQLVAEDRWGYKWIKWVTSIEVSNDTSYRGYWERRGYSNEGDLNESFIE
jgi:DMSO/TMAO reductase YedYZ molybdopterin-dependent catalytic subunit